MDSLWWSVLLIYVMFFWQYFPDKFVRRDINALEMVCVYSAKGCDWEGTFAKLEVREK